MLKEKQEMVMTALSNPERFDELQRAEALLGQAIERLVRLGYEDLAGELRLIEAKMLDLEENEYGR